MTTRIDRLALALAVAGTAALSGCSAEGPDGSVTFREESVPFTFRHPAGFTEEAVDELNSRGDVVAVRALDKVNVIAVRRVGDSLRERRETRLRVLGKQVSSLVVPVGDGWAIECQWTDERRDEVRDACDEALRSRRPHRG